MLGVRAVVGEHRDLGGAGLGVDADDALEQPLGGGDVDVAGAGDQADRLAHVVAVVDAVGERGDRLGAAHRPHLVDAEQGAGGEDRRVRPARRGRPAAGWPRPGSAPRRAGPGTTFMTTLLG